MNQRRKNFLAIKLMVGVCLCIFLPVSSFPALAQEPDPEYIQVDQANVQKYSVFNIWRVDASDLVGNPSNFDNQLTEIANKGFNTISLAVLPDVIETPAPGYLSRNNPAHRDHYKELYRHILDHDGDFYLILRIWNADIYMINVGDETSQKLSWGDNDFFLRHKNIPVKPGHIDLIGTPWVEDIDFYPDNGLQRRRMLNFNNPVVRSLVKDIWCAVIDDIVDTARSLNKEDKILTFTLNTTPFAESEYWFDFFVGNDGDQFNNNFKKANNDIARINWIDEWQNDLRDLHGELSDLVLSKSVSAGSPFNFKFGAQFSAAYDAAGLKRGTFDLANAVSKLNRGDWLNNADIASVVFPGYNHNFSMDYYGSIGEWKDLVVSNEISWPGFLMAWGGLTKEQEADAYKQQAIQSYIHGARAFFVTNWSVDQLLEPEYADLIQTITMLYNTPDTYVPERTAVIFIDPWAVYKTEEPNTNNVANVYGRIQSVYGKVSSNGNSAVKFVTSPMLVDQPNIFESFRSAYLPALNEVISREAYNILIEPENIKKLRLEDTNIGRLNKFQQTQVPISKLKANDLLWVDKLNKFPGDVSPDLPGLQVALSSGSGFEVATLWSSWGGLENSLGFYVGDFNGDGYDDFLNFASNVDPHILGLEVVLSTGAGFTGLQTWGGWGADGKDLFVGDFGTMTEEPTAITLLSFTAQPAADHVTLAWETGSEVDNAGFNLHRATAAGGPYTQINEALIPAEGNPESGASYVYTDTNVVKGVTYYYKLEDVDIHGVSTFHGPVAATPSPIQQIYLPLLLK